MQRIGIIALVIVLALGTAIWWKTKWQAGANIDSSASPSKESANPAIVTNPTNPKVAIPTPGATPANPAAETNSAHGEEAPPLMAPLAFAQMIESTEKMIPTRAQLKNLSPEQAHETPQSIIDAAGQMGLVADAIKKNPALEPEAFAFYERCAGNVDFPSSVRALCLSDYERIGKDLNLSVNEGIAPLRIHELADKIKGL